jgi:hypothetical protein
MAKKIIHLKKSSSWWNGTVTAMCGLTVPKEDVVRTWFASLNCPGCRAAIGRGRK